MNWWNILSNCSLSRRLGCVLPSYLPQSLPPCNDLYYHLRLYCLPSCPPPCLSLLRCRVLCFSHWLVHPNNCKLGSHKHTTVLLIMVDNVTIPNDLCQDWWCELMSLCHIVCAINYVKEAGGSVKLTIRSTLYFIYIIYMMYMIF